MTDTAKSAPAAPAPAHHIWTRTIPAFLNYIVLILAVGLLAFISYDTYQGMDFMNNPLYLKYQLAVCGVFSAEYLYRFLISHHKIRFMIISLPYLLICIPYLNIINYYSLEFPVEVLFCIRFIPLLRGLVALIMVVTFIAEKLTTTVFACYILVMIPVSYMSALIFYMVEKQVNPAVKNFWYAIWWAGMNVTTIGCNINPVTGTGMTLGFVLSLMGIIMLPLFTVYFGDVIQSYSNKYQKRKK